MPPDNETAGLPTEDLVPTEDLAGEHASADVPAVALDARSHAPRAAMGVATNAASRPSHWPGSEAGAGAKPGPGRGGYRRPGVVLTAALVTAMVIAILRLVHH